MSFIIFSLNKTLNKQTKRFHFFLFQVEYLFYSTTGNPKIGSLTTDENSSWIDEGYIALEDSSMCIVSNVKKLFSKTRKNIGIYFFKEMSHQFTKP